MADIITRLLLNTQDFDAKLSKSQKELQGYSGQLKKISEGVGAAFKGLAGAVGAAVGGIELFDKAMKANENNNDIYENTLRAVTNVTNEYLSAITSADFSTFYLGLDNVIAKAKDTAEALRQIEDAQTAFGYTSSINRADFNEYLATMKDPNATAAEKSAAKTGASGVVARQREESQALSEKAVNAATALLTQRSLLSAGSVSEIDIEKTLRLALSAQSGGKIEQLEAQYGTYLKEAQAIRSMFTEVVTLASGQKVEVFHGNEAPAYAQQMNGLNNKYSEALLYQAMFNKTNGDDLKTLVSFLQQAQAARGEVASMEKSLNRAGSSIGAGTKTAGRGLLSPTAADGSIAALEQKLKAMNDLLINTADEEVRATARATIKAYEQQIAAMKAGPRKELEFMEASTLAPGLLTGAKKDGSGKGLAKEKTPGEGITKTNDVMTEGIAIANTFADSLKALGGVVDEGAAAWLQYGANAIQAIANVIPLIVSLTGAKKKATDVSMTKTIVESGEAVAGTPVVGPALALAAIASVGAALMAIPKFAGGGIVPGSNFSGDKVLTRLNSGEMVLNGSQQKKLFDMINQGRSAELHVTGRLVGSGKELQCVLDEYQHYRRL